MESSTQRKRNRTASKDHAECFAPKTSIAQVANTFTSPMPAKSMARHHNTAQSTPRNHSARSSRLHKPRDDVMPSSLHVGHESNANKRRKLENAETSLSFQPNIAAPANENAYITWAKGIMDDLPRWSQSNLPPILSYIWLPYAQPDSKWSRSWMPSNLVEEAVEPWQIALMYALGASTMDMAERMVTIGRDQVDYEKAKRQTKARLRKRLDEWRKKYGGLMFREGTPKKPTKMFESVFTGVFVSANGDRVKYREPLSDLQVAFNCAWKIDEVAGVMIQPSTTPSTNKRRRQQAPARHDNLVLFERHPIPDDIKVAMDTNEITQPDLASLRVAFPAFFRNDSGLPAMTTRRHTQASKSAQLPTNSVAVPHESFQDRHKTLFEQSLSSVTLPPQWHVGGPFFQDPSGNIFAQPEHYPQPFIISPAM